MKLLIITQAVDAEDPTLGFFVRWIEELSKRAESVEVICLKKGTYSLPNNARVHSLGKPASRFRYIWNFYKHIFSLKYDAVFVHMNEEYVLFGGLFWRLMEKKVFLWRNHAKGSLQTRLAGALSLRVFYTSPGSYTATFENAVRMPVGIDTEYFSPVADVDRHGVLVLGRLDPVKRVTEMIDAARIATKQVPIALTILGCATQTGSIYEQHVLQALALFNGAQRVPSVPHSATLNFFRRAEVLLNFTREGSFDKTIFEAAACGALPLVTNTGLRGILPDECITSLEGAPQALVRLLRLSEGEKERLRISCRESIAVHHSLALLVNELTEAMWP